MDVRAAPRRDGSSAAASLADGLLAAVSALVPAALAANRVTNVPGATRDPDVVRAVGLAPSVWREPETIVDLLLQAVPLGTRTARAGLGGALAVAGAGAVLFALARVLLDACAPTRRLGASVAAIAAVLALVGVPWQCESSVVGGAATGALLALLPLYVLVAPPWRAAPGAAQAVDGRTLHAAAFVLGLAVSSGPSVGACAAAGPIALAAVDASVRRAIGSAARNAASIGLAFAAGLAPFALGVARVRGSGASVTEGVLAGWLTAVSGPAPSAWSSIWTYVGGATLLFAAAGVGMSGVVARARPLAVALLATTCAGLALARLAPPASSRYVPPLLVALASSCVLAGAGMQALVRAVASARVPMARASAAMVLLLVLVLPVDAADDALAHGSADGAVAEWDDAAWGTLPPSAVVLLPSPTTWQRAMAARARGALRGDLTVVPLASPGSGPAARRALASDPALLPLWRDVEIAGAPSEASLSAVAAVRALATSYEPRWGRVLAGHLVPDGLFDRFALEPRGPSDRRAALAAFLPRRERLARLTRDDDYLSTETARLLRARALLFATLDSRDADAIAGAVADVRAFAPDDAVVTQLALRLSTKAPPRLDDLRP